MGENSTKGSSGGVSNHEPGLQVQGRRLKLQPIRRWRRHLRREERFVLFLELMNRTVHYRHRAVD